LSAQALVEITLGPPGAEITKKAEAEPTVYMKPDAQGKVRPYNAQLELSGGWSGRVGSDIGPIRLYTSDRNANGVYNDPNDAAVLSVTRSYDQSWNSSSNVELPAGRVGNIGGKLFIVEVSAVGDTVKLKPYTGSTGKVNVSTFDSSGKPAKVSTVSFAGDTGRMSYYSKTTSGFVLPSGSYSCTVTVQLPVKAKYGGYETLDMKTKTPVTVSKGKTTSIRFGGPLQMQIGSGKGPIEVKQGIGRDIMVTFSTPNSSVDTSTGLTIPVNVRNATGKVVWSSTAEYT
jgi:hypothetical protein